jgi:transposase
MIDESVRTEIRRLVLGEGWRIGTVARHLGVHHGVVRRALRGPLEIVRPPAPSALEPYKPYIVERLGKYPELTSTRLLLELRDRGYEHGIAVIKRFVAHVRGPRSKKAYLRIETLAGEQAQVDWGSFGWMRVGTTQRRLSCFVMLLSWSRALFLDFSLDQRMETFCEMHQRAFEFFQGVPHKILYDNLKTVVLHHLGSTVQFNPTFLAFAGQYLFEPTAAPPRYPQAKGGVEGAIRLRSHIRLARRHPGQRCQVARRGRQRARPRHHARAPRRPPPHRTYPTACASGPPAADRSARVCHRVQARLRAARYQLVLGPANVRRQIRHGACRSADGASLRRRCRDRASRPLLGPTPHHRGSGAP